LSAPVQTIRAGKQIEEGGRGVLFTNSECSPEDSEANMKTSSISKPLFANNLQEIQILLFHRARVSIAYNKRFWMINLTSRALRYGVVNKAVVHLI
jgi:hypothetical protein